MFGETLEHFFLFTSAPFFLKIKFAHLLHALEGHSLEGSFLHALHNLFVAKWSISRSKDLVPRSRSSGLISPTSLTEMHFLTAEMLLGTMTYPDRDDDKLT